jgi:aryl-alcohol dehydrogenase-like predicted oxidoreductase
MQYRRLGHAGAQVSALCLGTVYYGNQVTPADAERVIHRALDRGVNFIDTAESYQRPREGIAEQVVGQALVGRRHEVFLATKKRYDPDFVRTGTPKDHGLSRSHIMLAIEGSLRRLRTDYVDLYYPHQVDLATPLDETLRAFEDLVRSGKVRYLGLSNYPAWKTVKALWLAERHGYQSISCVQVLYNLLDRTVERDVVPCCAAYGLGVVPYSPLAGGILSGKYDAGAQAIPAGSRAALSGFRTTGRPGHIPILNDRNLQAARQLANLAAAFGVSAASLAIAWVLHQPFVSSVIFGASTIDQLEANLAAADLRLTPGQLVEIATVGAGGS